MVAGFFMSTTKENQMNNPFQHYPFDIARAAASAFASAARAIPPMLGRAWATHKRLLANNPAYATALAGGVAAIVRQISGERIAIAVLSTLIAVYLATHQDQRPRGWGYDDGLDIDLYPY
jgi:hypothetical protein